MHPSGFAAICNNARGIVWEGRRRCTSREVVVENDPEKLDEALAVYRSRLDELEKVGCVASYLLRDRSEARLTWLSVWEEGSADARGEQTEKRVDIVRQVAEVLGGVRQTVPELEVLERYP